MRCPSMLGVLLSAIILPAPSIADRAPAESGSYATYSLLHEIGAEHFALKPQGDGSALTVSATVSDRGTTRANDWTLEVGPSIEPRRLEMKRAGAPADEIYRTIVRPGMATVQEYVATRSFTPPATAFVGFQAMPASLQMLMMRYWQSHGEPGRLPILRASDKALPIEIRKVGTDKITIAGAPVTLTRYTLANYLFGREILWMDPQGRLAALMTFAGGLPMEQILDRYEPALDPLVRSGVAQEMADLDELGRLIRPEASGTYAIVGARLIDGTGAPSIENAAVLVRNGKIVAAGPRGSVHLPTGVRQIHAEGQSLLPGLWEMHSHYSGIEFGPALLAAGVTTARDCGGEFGFLMAVRHRIDAEKALGPRLLLAGLIDSGGILGFGAVDVETPAEGVAAVDRYADAHFSQIKVYNQIKPDVLRAITAEAHRRGMTVTGHVPNAVDTFKGVADGMDQINHLQYVSRAMQPEGGGPIDLTSDRARRMIALLKSRRIVVDPTIAWGEMAGHPRTISAASFEPGLNAAPFTLQSKYEALGGATDEAKFRERIAANGRVVKALHDAGVPIVAGSDTNLIGYGLDAELELYVQAGLSPMEAIQTATLNAARAMRLEREVGTIEPGKRADLMLVNGNPLAQISDLRRVTKVVRTGDLYDSQALGRLVGFERTH